MESRYRLALRSRIGGCVPRRRKPPRDGSEPSGNGPIAGPGPVSTGLDGASPWQRRRRSPQLNLIAVYSAGVGCRADAKGYVLSVNAAFNGAAGSATSRSETAGRRFQLSGQGATVLNQRVKRIARNC